jgi:DNA-binding transcriptional MocR family regulator
MKILFKLKDKIICEYSSFEGLQEVLETRELLAHENGVDKNEITVQAIEDNHKEAI